MRLRRGVKLRLWDYIAKDKDSPKNADRFVDQLYSKGMDLSALGGIGRRHDELTRGVMSIPHHRYIIFFTRDDTTVRIIRILNGARDLDNLCESYPYT